MAEVFLALGSNLGDRVGNLAAAREALAREILDNLTASSIYDTEPWGPIKQGRYLNQVARGTTTLAPRALLGELQKIEISLGRDRAKEERYGPRTIDLDILLYDQVVLNEADLTIPHPRMTERPFVLVPLAEIAPDLEIADVPLKRLLARLDRSAVAISKQTA
jgi:2-amino-4-hydroxy-6-hydroxymethyldihydropteridine diphosphokinase